MAVVLGLAIAWTYANTMLGLGREWLSSPDSSYGLVLVAVAALVAWQRRADLIAFARSRSASPEGGIVGVFLLTAGLLFNLAGQLGADVFLTRVSLVFVLAGAVWFVAGAAVVRRLTAPLAFLLMAIPLPALLVNTVTLPLQFTASQIAESALTTTGVPVFRDGNVLELPSATLEVAEACSGLRSLVSLTAIAILLAWAAAQSPAAFSSRRSRILRAVAIVAAAWPIAIVMNGLRIAAIGIACEEWGPQMAVGAWHTFSGWVVFVVSAIVLAALQRAIAPAATQPPAVEGAVAA